MTGTGTARPPRPWLAECSCGHEDRSGTHAGAIVLSEAHRATMRRQSDQRRHDVKVVHRPQDDGRGDVALLLAVVALVVLVVGGVVTGLSSALGNLTDQVCSQQTTTSACEGRP